MSRLSSVARRVRAVPGYPVARRRVIRQVRGSRTARELVKRIFDVDGATAGPPTDVAAGRLLGGVGTESLPVVLVVMVGQSASAAEQTIEEVAQLQLLGAGFRPVLLTDRAMFGIVRQHGYPVELVPGEEMWLAQPVNAGRDWTEEVRSRIQLALRTYRATATVTVGPQGLDQSGRLLLSAIGPQRVGSTA